VSRAPAFAYAGTYALMIIPAWWFITRLLARRQEGSVPNMDLPA